MQHERTDLPRFRRFSVLPAFVDGWALYAATLGEELGLYHDAQARFGALLAQTRCAAGLVVDTGLHAQGWSRQRALDYLREQVPMDGDDADRIVGRMLALPAEALACSGFLKIQALRVRAQQVLGARFELSAFHQAVAGDGAMPLDLLEPKVRAWIEAAASAPAAPSPAGPPAGAPGGNPAEPERSGAAGDASMPTARR